MTWNEVAAWSRAGIFANLGVSPFILWTNTWILSIPWSVSTLMFLATWLVSTEQVTWPLQ